MKSRKGRIQLQGNDGTLYDITVHVRSISFSPRSPEGGRSDPFASPLDLPVASPLACPWQER